MPIRVGQALRAAAASIWGQPGSLVFPSVAVGAGVAVGPGLHPLAATILTVLLNVFSNLTADKLQSLLERLGELGANYDVEKVFIDSIHLALGKARDGLTPDEKVLYGDWFANWGAPFEWARKDAGSTSDLFRGKQAFTPTDIAASSGRDDWDKYRAMLERWAWENQIRGKDLLISLLAALGSAYHNIYFVSCRNWNQPSLSEPHLRISLCLGIRFPGR